MYKISKEESSRIEIVRVLMCIAVLFIHSYLADVDSNQERLSCKIAFIISKILCSCAVPTFTLISAILLYRKNFDWKKNICNKVRELLIPYLIFNTLWIVMQCIKYYVVAAKINDPTSDYLNLSILQWIGAYVGVSSTAYRPALTLLYYLRDLFILNIFAILIKKAIDRFPVLIAVIISFYWFLDTPTIFVQKHTICFFILGYYVVKYKIYMDAIDKLKIADIGFAYLISVIADYIWRDSFPIIHQLQIIISMITVIYISKYLLKYRTEFLKISYITYFIFLSHRFVYNVIIFLISGSLTKKIIFFYIAPWITFSLLIAIHMGMNKYTPRLLCILTGKKELKF